MAAAATGSPTPETSEAAQTTKPVDVLKMAVRRLTSRAALIRQSSAALLRHDTTPSLLRKTSAINLFPELDDASLGPGIELYYYSGWDEPHLHYTSAGSAWTAPPGVLMKKCDNDSKTAANLPAFGGRSLSEETIWISRVKGVDDLEFVPNNRGRGWDKAPGNSNYFLNEPGRFILRNGVVRQLLDPPSKPALLKAAEVGTTHVSLVWNPPMENPALVAGYRVFRDGVLIASTGESEQAYTDSSLLGLKKYSYFVKAVNTLEQEGTPSEIVHVETGEPGKPSAPQNAKCTAHSTHSVDLQWHVPVDHGGSLVTSYKIYRNGNLHATTKASTGLAELFRDEMNIVADGIYVYHIAAVNKEGPILHRLSATTPRSIDTAESAVSDGCADLFESKQARDDYFRNIVVAKQADDEGALSEGIEVKAVTMLQLPRIHDGKSHIILQGFNWVSCHNRAGWYKVLLSKVPAMKESNISMVWLPPPCQSVADEGYMPTKWYRLDTKYGTEKELIALNTAMRDLGIVPMLDLVVNHRCGTKQDERGQWTIFEEPAWSGWAIVKNNVQGYVASGGQDTGAQSDCAPDLDHTNQQVRKDVKKWTAWLFEEIGFGALRIDMAPGYSVGYQVEYVENIDSPFTVGEYWNGDPNSLHNYTSGGRGRLAAFDFALYYVLRRCVENNNFEELSNNGRLQGLVGRDPERAVTFLDNHDTEHLTFVGKFGGGVGDVVLRGYVYILTHPGTPCIYWNHWSDYGDFMRQKLTALCNVRVEMGITSVSGVCIDRAQWGTYAAYISRERHCNRGGGQLAMVIGSGRWEPEGGNWKKRVDGNGFSVWSRG